MKKLKEILKELSNTLIENKSPIGDLFNDGLKKKYIQSLIDNQNFNPIKELFDIFSWKNGIDIETASEKNIDTDLVPLGTFYPLENSIDMYNLCLQHRVWKDSLFPLFNSGSGGDFYLVDTDKSQETFGMLLFYSPTNSDFENVITYSDSLADFFNSVLQCYKERGYSYTELNGMKYLNTNPEIEKLIFKRNNPKSDYWNLV